MASTIVHLLLPGARQRPRDIAASERFPPLPKHDVLFSAHRNYQTPANQAYRALKPTRSLNLNIEAEVKRPLHEKLREMFGPNVPAPKFWIGDDKVRSQDHIKSDTSRTFAIGRLLHRCCTMHEATDEGIKAEILRNGSRRELPEILDVSETNTSTDETRNTLSAATNMSLASLDSVDLESAVARLPTSTIADANMSRTYCFTTNTLDSVRCGQITDINYRGRQHVAFK